MENRNGIATFLVDDSSAFRRALRLVLEARDHVNVVGEAESGEDALEQLQTLARQAVEVDLTIVDAYMPGMNGYELIGRLKQQWPAMRVLVVSVYDGPYYAQHAFNAGADGFLSKYEARDHLLEAIDVVTEGKRYPAG